MTRRRSFLVKRDLSAQILFLPLVGVDMCRAHLFFVYATTSERSVVVQLTEHLLKHSVGRKIRT